VCDEIVNMTFPRVLSVVSYIVIICGQGTEGIIRNIPHRISNDIYVDPCKAGLKFSFLLNCYLLHQGRKKKLTKSMFLIASSIF
jgi:hypothetical protein